MNQCFFGDCRDVLRRMIADGVRVNMVATSPPYWGLRDYGTATWEGGDVGCDHVGILARTVSGGDGKQYTNEGSNRVFSGDCKCGARRVDSQLGLEPTLAEYVANLVEVFSLVREVLTDDGTCWINLGDTMLPNKCEAMAPHRVAMALMDDGWICRQTIVWKKPNPMPESVRDRCTKSHEYVFMLTKKANYYYDADAIKEPAIYFDDDRKGRAKGEHKSAPDAMKNGIRPVYKDTRDYDGKHADKQRGHGRRHAGFNDRWDGMSKVDQCSAMRNKRSVWTIATKPYAGAHFATFPEKLIEPMILAGSRPGDIVLDPFMGSGTVGKVAQSLGRNWLGIDLNPAYGKLQDDRITQYGFAL